VIDIWTWVGALIIFASAVYVSRREAILRRNTAHAPKTVQPGPPVAA
jgi:drug/metabolite transporter (DMT)-like permease